ncbi:MAG: radical SAM protein [Candidatus Tectomicrobia bacterium]|nr:radical SAM protein [Candidatus Tectomicrobia bacterium]
MTITFTERGCISACTYCSAPFYSRVRRRHIENILEELRWIVSLGIKEVRFFDCGFTNHVKFAHKLLDEMIREKLDLNWVCNARADRISPDLVEKMKAAGCHMVCIGAESSDPMILKNIKKHITSERVEEAVSQVKKGGMSTTVYFMMGLPGETRETIKETIEFARRLNPDLATFGIATPHPGTEFYRYMKEHGYLITDDWSQFDPMKKPVFSYPDLSSEEIYEAMQAAYTSFYLRPSYIFGRMKGLRTWLDLKNLLQNFLGFTQRFLLKGGTVV